MVQINPVVVTAKSTVVGPLTEISRSNFWQGLIHGRGSWQSMRVQIRMRAVFELGFHRPGIPPVN